MQPDTDAKTKGNVRRTGKLRKAYKIASAVLGLAAIGYLLLLCFPRPLFAYTANYERFTIYSREPIDPGIERVLDGAETRLRTSPIYDGEISRRIYLTNGFGIYALLSNKAYKSFANSVPFINNVIIDKSNVAADLVFVNRPINNSRSLSGVVAHEITHLFIRQRYGTVRAILMPTWKNEGYCEYVAGDSTIPLDEGLRLWRENPTDDTDYRYTKYHAMIKYLLEKEHMTVDDLFTRDLDEKEVAAKTFANL